MDDPRFRSDFSPNTRELSTAVLFSRRWHCPHPYVSFVTKLPVNDEFLNENNNALKSDDDHNNNNNNNNRKSKTSNKHIHNTIHHHSNDDDHKEDSGASSLALTLQDDARTILAWLIRYRCGEQHCLSWYDDNKDGLLYTPSFHALVRKGLKMKSSIVRYFPDATLLRSVEVDEPHSEEQFIFVKRPIVKIDAAPVSERTDVTHCGRVDIGLRKQVPLLTILDTAMYIETCLVTSLAILIKRRNLSILQNSFLNRAKIIKLILTFGLFILLIVLFAAVSRISKPTPNSVIH